MTARSHSFVKTRGHRPRLQRGRMRLLSVWRFVSLRRFVIGYSAMTERPFLIILVATILAVSLNAQQGGRASPPLPPLPQMFETAQQKIRVSAVATGLANPWSLAFLPNGDM